MAELIPLLTLTDADEGSEGGGVGGGGVGTYSENYSPSESGSEGWSEGESCSEGRSEGFTDSPMLVPLLGREVSSMQYRPLQEQLHRAMAVIEGQDTRAFVAKLEGVDTRPLPESLVVDVGGIDEEDEMGYRTRVN